MQVSTPQHSRGLKKLSTAAGQPQQQQAAKTSSHPKAAGKRQQQPDTFLFQGTKKT